MNHKDLKALRDKLPAKGYVAMIRKNAGKRITPQIIRNFFSNRSTSPEAAEAIIKAAVKVTSQLKRDKQRLSKLAKTA
jgi:hypothetical protein